MSSIDLDSGDNSLVKYSISQPDSASFSINAENGVITAKQSLTTGRNYNFQVTATDKVRVFTCRKKFKRWKLDLIYVVRGLGTFNIEQGMV